MSQYCKICKNEEVFTNKAPCPDCQRYVVDGWLAEAYRRWRKVAEDNTPCCRGLSYWFGKGTDPSAREQGNLYFHGKWWEGEHKGTFVEYGVSFHHDHARTYFLRDFDHTADSEEYGESIPYLDPEFWDRLDKQLSHAPEAAWKSGLRSCEKCGYHYYETCGCEAEEVSDGEAV